MDGYDKAYNTHLIKLWLENNYDNYVKTAKRYHDSMTLDEVLAFVKTLEYGGDREKIDFVKDKIYLKDIKECMREIMEGYYN